MQIGNGQFFLGDCFDVMRDLPDGSVDMILCDLPYGTTACKWDSVLPFEELWSEYWRVAKPNAAVVLFAAQPFTSALVMSEIKNFKYSWVWNKVVSRGHLVAKKRPMANHEDICVFYRKPGKYAPQMVEKVRPEKGRSVEHSRTSIMRGATTRQSEAVVRTHSYPKTIIEVPSEPNGASKFHPTQKPVALFEYLIRTYTNPGDVVLDNTAGSGTTAVAAERTGRKWICIEKQPEYYYPAVARVISEVSSQ